MPRGCPAKVGDETVAQNGYTWVRTLQGQRYKHHVIAEKKLRRKLDLSVERVIFIDQNRRNFDPDNIDVVLKRKQTPETRRARLEAKRDDALAKAADIQEQIDALCDEAS